MKVHKVFVSNTNHRLTLDVDEAAAAGLPWRYRVVRASGDMATLVRVPEGDKRGVSASKKTTRGTGSHQMQFKALSGWPVFAKVEATLLISGDEATLSIPPNRPAYFPRKTYKRNRKVARVPVYREGTAPDEIVSEAKRVEGAQVAPEPLRSLPSDDDVVALVERFLSGLSDLVARNSNAMAEEEIDRRAEEKFQARMADIKAMMG